MEDTMKAYRSFVVKSLREYNIERPKGCENNIDIDHIGTCCEDGRWMELAQDRAQ